MMAMGRPILSLPWASRLMMSMSALSPLRKRLGAGGLEGFATTGQARIGHEILMGVEWFLALGGCDPTARAVRQHGPALLVVEQVGQHDLVENLLMNRRVD